MISQALRERLRAWHTQIHLSSSGLAFELPRPLKLPPSKAPGRPKPMPFFFHAIKFPISKDCAVVEDTVTGVMSGVTAGATVFGCSPPEAGRDAPDMLIKTGALRTFTNMNELLALLG